MTYLDVLVAAEKRKDMLAEASNYRLIKQSKLKKNSFCFVRLRTWLDHHLEIWIRWLMN
jgi:hypothetical protein